MADELKKETRSQEGRQTRNRRERRRQAGRRGTPCQRAEEARGARGRRPGCGGARGRSRRSGRSWRRGSAEARRGRLRSPPSVSAPTAAELLADDLAGKKIVKAKGAKNIVSGIANILATFNNTLVSITDMQGHVIGWSSAGRVGFKGSRKSTAYAAQQVAQDAARQAMSHGMREIEVRVKGPGSGRESAIRALQAIGLEITTIKDVTPVPHNGCRPRKKRRV